MENRMPRMLIEAVVKNALKSIQEDPERGIRNLVDLAMQFSEGRFQKAFFSAAQTMLQNENSAYYRLARDTVAHTDINRLYTFGMNLGYNGCTLGAQRIRENEKGMRCHIPWAVILQMDEGRLADNGQEYHDVIGEGEALGIYVWMLFAMGHPESALPLAKSHTDSAFCIFCQAKDLTLAFLDEVSEWEHIMLVIRYEESAAKLCDALRHRGFLYSVWYPYGQKDVEAIINGDLFSSMQQVTPVFSVLLPERHCSIAIQNLVYQTIKRARGEQTYSTILWELQGDNSLIDTIISEDTCPVCFDKNGDLCTWDQRIDSEYHNLFQDTLAQILTSGYPKETGNPRT